MSLFQNQPPSQRTLPLSLGIEAAIIGALRSVEELTEAVINDTIVRSFSLVYPPAEVKRQRDALAVRVTERLTQATEKVDTKSTIPQRKSLGSQYAEWITAMDAEQVCLYLANYDPDRAYQLYWQSDVETVQAAAALKGQHDSQTALLRMEACLYGFGGKYEGDEGRVSEHNIDSPEAAQQLQSLGF